MSKRMTAFGLGLFLSAGALYAGCSNSDCTVKCQDVENTCIQKCTDDACKTVCKTQADSCTLKCDTTSRPDSGY